MTSSQLLPSIQWVTLVFGGGDGGAGHGSGLPTAGSDARPGE
jgi:hypothetical protein